MRYDLFYGRKSVHMKLTKEKHVALRTKLLRYGITMQDVFEDLVDTVLEDTPKAENILNKIAKRKLNAAIEGMKKLKNRKIGEFDVETLYDLIEGNYVEDDDVSTEREERRRS